MTAAFYSFSPRAVAAHVPRFWRTAAPGDVLAARTRAVERTLGPLLGDGAADPGLARAAALAREAEALVSFAGSGAAPEENFASRGWSAQEWAGARGRLVARGRLDADGTATERGRREREEIERATDELAAAPYRALAPEGRARLTEGIAPVLGAVRQAGMLPSQSTLGILTVPRPDLASRRPCRVRPDVTDGAGAPTEGA